MTRTRRRTSSGVAPSARASLAARTLSIQETRGKTTCPIMISRDERGRAKRNVVVRERGDAKTV